MVGQNLTPEKQSVVLVGAGTLHQAEKLIIGCEGCSPCDAEISFDSILDRVTGNNRQLSHYVFVDAKAYCPNCSREINEKTLVEVVD
jgi:hypothetical protein